MWESEVDGRPLKFHLAGINNQNFIMRDEETGSWWQQVSGEALHGPLKGRQLKAVLMDEISFGIWKNEHPQGRVLRPDDRVSKKYEAANWEEEYAKLRVPVIMQDEAKEKLPLRELIVGIALKTQSKAYPMADLQHQKLVLDTLDGVPIFLIVGTDNKSVRAFERNVEGQTLDFFLKPETIPLQIIDSETNSIWDFSGKALQGPMTGRQLKQIPILKDYWFDWKIYHPKTFLYTLGLSTKQH